MVLFLDGNTFLTTSLSGERKKERKKEGINQRERQGANQTIIFDKTEKEREKKIVLGMMLMTE